MILRFECECGNEVGFHLMGDRDEHGRYWLDVEDDDRLAVLSGEGGSLLKCAFCGTVYRLQTTD
ncbi:hypothetical protein [Paenibacillus humicola]|uniref:hypothetical protein n=1 Tax=Paenibacillus humicola TaxID=3110540 RepID=UPI00237A4543|nr:hypothetical protein [Paenibacillus humicola]